MRTKAQIIRTAKIAGLLILFVIFIAKTVFYICTPQPEVTVYIQPKNNVRVKIVDMGESKIKQVMALNVNSTFIHTVKRGIFPFLSHETQLVQTDSSWNVIAPSK